ncbi:MAG: AAA family ATPase [Erysipelotrichia bacterium]|nr:AAA family ATPase [Erysipelotrichia bacterium]
MCFHRKAAKKVKQVNMDSRDKKRAEEKERLMKQVLGTKRAYEKDGSDTSVTLSNDTDAEEGKTAAESSTFENTMRSADETLNALKEVLTRQASDLQHLSNEKKRMDDADQALHETVYGTPKVETSDVDRLQKDLEQDYGVEPEVKKDIDSGKVFSSVQEELMKKLSGNDEAIKSLCSAFRRPYVMGRESDRAENVILVTGPKGSGRHSCLTMMADALKERQVIASSEVYTIDMSLYQSGSQEQIFLQDLYKALNGNGSIVCFENFETGFPSFLRMIDSLVCNGKVILNKRYVLSRGILIENQTGLVKEAVDSLNAAGKYLVFMTSRGNSAVQDAFGAGFVYHILDTVNFTAIDENGMREIIDAKMTALIDRAQQHLKIQVNADQSLKDWIIASYDKTNGADAVASMFDDFYICISQEVLSDNASSASQCTLTCRNGSASGTLDGREFSIVRSRTSEEELKDINAQLDAVVGLEQVKSYIRSLQDHIRVQQLRRQQGMKVSEVSKHMIFTGNPGTGKTTIARLVSRYMKAIGALSQGQLVEVTRGDLVAQYVGQTAPLTMGVIKSALGGVLFIDEAYALYRGKDDSFGLECIDTLVKAMEDHRNDLIVILAGYKKEMSVFLESNSGLKSRFPNIIDFADYSGEELQKIADSIAHSKGYVIADDAEKPLQQYFDKVQSVNAAEAGNGRLARNVVEEAILKQSGRLVAHPDSRMEELLLDDFDLTVKVQPPKEDSLTF